jgi:hypothetical protein
MTWQGYVELNKFLFIFKDVSQRKYNTKKIANEKLF